MRWPGRNSSAACGVGEPHGRGHESGVRVVAKRRRSAGRRSVAHFVEAAPIAGCRRPRPRRSRPRREPSAGGRSTVCRSAAVSTSPAGRSRAAATTAVVACGLGRQSRDDESERDRDERGAEQLPVATYADPDLAPQRARRFGAVGAAKARREEEAARSETAPRPPRRRSAPPTAWAPRVTAGRRAASGRRARASTHRFAQSAARRSRRLAATGAARCSPRTHREPPGG